jgi:hypothetical protein
MKCEGKVGNVGHVLEIAPRIHNVYVVLDLGWTGMCLSGGNTVYYIREVIKEDF